MPANHRYRADWTPERIRIQAAQVRPNVGTFAQMVMRKRRHLLIDREAASLDRLVHNAYRIELEGQSFRKQEVKSGDGTPEN